MSELTDSGMVTYGEPVKALGNGRVGGYLVRFGTPAAKDLTGDYFTPETYFGPALETIDTYYNHGKDPTLRLRVIGTTKARITDAGVWAETQLQMRDAYEQMVYQLAQKGKLSYSSGTADHLIDRDTDGKLKRWAIVEASLTPTPAEPRGTQIVALKSLALGEPLTLTDAPSDTARAAEWETLLAEGGLIQLRANHS